MQNLYRRIAKTGWDEASTLSSKDDGGRTHKCAARNKRRIMRRAKKLEAAAARKEYEYEV